MSAHPDTGQAGATSGSGVNTAALILLVIALIGAVVELFWRPFEIALPALLITLVGIRLSDRYRRLGVITMFAITICFVIGASFAVWDSRPL